MFAASARLSSPLLPIVPLVLMLSGCAAEREAPPSPHAIPSEAPAIVDPAAPGAAESRALGSAEALVYGDPIDPGVTRVPLGNLVASPRDFEGQSVRSEGTVSAVCQRMGCWMELRDDEGHRVRVPMAGHRFFLPRTISGRTAEVQGSVSVRPLSEEERAHLASEGAEATDVALQIEATGVRLRPVTDATDS